MASYMDMRRAMGRKLWPWAKLLAMAQNLTSFGPWPEFHCPWPEFMPMANTYKILDYNIFEFIISWPSWEAIFM